MKRAVPLLSYFGADRPCAVAIDAVAEALPFADHQFDVSMATFTVHQWTNLERGLGETRRVTRGPVIILTCDPTLVQRFWLNDYAPEVLATEARRYPSLERVRACLGGASHTLDVAIRSTAPMALTKPITGDPSGCWKTALAQHAGRGASSWPRPAKVRSSTCGASFRTALGMRDSGIFDANQPTAAPFG